MQHPYEPLRKFCEEAERLNPRNNPFSPGVLEYVTATLKLFLADKEKSLDKVFRVKQDAGNVLRRRVGASYKPAKPGKEARIALRASRLRANSEMTWQQIAEQIGYPDPKKLPDLVKQHDKEIKEADKRSAAVRAHT
jgi:hypothetical protein